jgi:pentatricopeptide repeat protein
MAPGTIQLHIFSWNTKLARYFKMGQYDEKSIELFQQMQQEGLMIPDTLNFIWVLNALASLRALQECRHVHMQIMQSGCQLDAYVGSSLTEFVATFVSLLPACSHAGLLDEGLVYFDSMCSVYGISATVKHYMLIWLISWPGWPSAGGRGFDQYDVL